MGRSITQYTKDNDNMGKNRIIDIVKHYGMIVDPDDDINFLDAIDIVLSSHSKMEIAGNSYLYGHMQGNQSAVHRLPVYDLPQISDERWNQLAKTMKGV